MVRNLIYKSYQKPSIQGDDINCMPFRELCIDNKYFSLAFMFVLYDSERTPTMTAKLLIEAGLRRNGHVTVAMRMTSPSSSR